MEGLTDPQTNINVNRFEVSIFEVNGVVSLLQVSSYKVKVERGFVICMYFVRPCSKSIGRLACAALKRLVFGSKSLQSPAIVTTSTFIIYVVAASTASGVLRKPIARRLNVFMRPMAIVKSASSFSLKTAAAA